MKKSGILLTILISIVLILQILGLLLIFTNQKNKNDFSALYKDVAAKLKGVDLKSKSIEYYTKYLDQNVKISPKIRSNILYHIGKMYFENGKFEDALGYLYLAEIMNPKSELKSEIGELIMNCLERLGKSFAAEYALESRTKMDKNNTSKGEKIVARIGSEEITLDEFTQSMEQIPKWMRDEKLNTKEGKIEFLNKYVADILLHRKATKEGLDKDPEIKQRLLEIEKDLLVQKIIEREIKDKIKIDDDMIKLYYEANKSKYKDKEGRKILPFDEVKEKISKDLYIEKMQKLYQELISKTIEASEVKLYPELIK